MTARLCARDLRPAGLEKVRPRKKSNGTDAVSEFRSDPKYKAVDTDRKLKLYGVCVCVRKRTPNSPEADAAVYPLPQYPGFPRGQDPEQQVSAAPAFALNHQNPY